ncbi:alpha/beta hydrolase [Allonocardiopsis opalescens]|uniref:Alpha/beta hydrolase family protein n=1 Tax=Allonocardiopsis opalescens TaxID=1144618 RepID=A0A2T0Q9P8_9ACTN|nr:alpha/beta hydrolase [Allonocardiopsis opalescens]PRY00619.1 alpha/beta hydrolase family protein [Allonocardiopsis opalescens]
MRRGGQRVRGAGRRLVALAVIGLAAPLLAVPAAADDGEPAAPVEWGACPEDVAAEAPEMECGLVPVPLDYSDPEGVQIDIMVSRLAGTDPAARRGVLLFNPGGPGGSGLDMPADLLSRGMPAAVADSYDLIGMDTRGVGYSAPVSCGFTTDYRGNIPPYAVDDAAVTEQAEVAEAAAEQCAANDTEGRLRHLTTANTARDLDRIRAALGEEQISFYGASYGTALGAAYASMFPERSDRIVLDSNIGDTHLDHAGIRRYGLGAEQTFPDFARWAAERHEEYGLGDSPEEVRATYFELAERLDEHPVELDGTLVDGPLFRLATFGTLYHDLLYPQTAAAWQSLLEPEGTAPDRPGDAALTWPPSAGDAEAGDAGSAQAEPSPYDNAWSVFLAVTCNDVQWPEDVDTYRRSVAADRERYPVFGAASANILPCAFWPHEPSEPPVEIVDEGPSNILIVQNQRDPVTPHLGGVLLDRSFGERSRLVSVDGSGHGVYVNDDNACAQEVTTAYLVEGEMPERDMFCPA